MPSLKSHGKSRQKLFKGLEDTLPVDFDPEEDGQSFGNASEDERLGITSSSEDELDGREHYEVVGESKLRKRGLPSLGPRYEGINVGRKGLVDEEELESDMRFDGEQEIGDEDEDEDEDMFSDSEGSEVEGGGNSEEVITGQIRHGRSGSDNDDSLVSDMDFDNEIENEDVTVAVSKDDRAELRRLMKDSQSSVAGTIAQANKADSEKGQAVQKQRATFDSLLNTRIRLQHGLVAVNSLANIAENKDDATGMDAFQAAEQAALRLWNTLDALRFSISDAQTGSKRKHMDAGEMSTSIAMWKHMQTTEDSCRLRRQKILQKWSAKAQSVTAVPLTRRLNNTPRATTVIDVIQNQLMDTDRMVKRTRVPRSCAPLQANAGMLESSSIYDDADFYGVLLKELLEQRNAGVASAYQIDAAAQQWKAVREVKTKKVVDTKASKGRKMRFTVHEKLQNFMAPEDRRGWSERQTDELFSSLLGKRMVLAEAPEDEDEESDVGEAALMLFRSNR